MDFLKHCLFIAGILALCAPAQAASSPSPDGPIDISQESAPCVVAVLTYDVQGRILSEGSGFFITPGGDVITSYRLFKTAASAEVVTPAGEVFPVTAVSAESPENDLIRLSVGTGERSMPCGRPAAAAPEPGEEVFVLGSPAIRQPSTIRSRVSGLRQIPFLGDIVKLTGPIPAGFLGGPVINKRGEVIGVTIIRETMRQRSAYAVPWASIHELAPKGPGAWTSPLSPGRRSFVKGVRNLWLGRYDRALPHLEAAVDSDPQNADRNFLLGYCYSSLSRFHDAVAAYRQALRFSPGSKDALYFLGLAYSKILCFQDAAEAFEEVVMLDPDDFRAFYKLGYAYSRLNWQEEARETFKRAIVQRCVIVSPDDPACSDNALLGLNDIIDAFRQSNWSEAQAADVHYQRGLIYITMARTDLALKELRTLRTLDVVKAGRLHDVIRP